MKLRVTRAASALVLAATLLAGCGQPVGQSTYGASAVRAVQAAQATAQTARLSAQGAASSAEKATSESSPSALSQWPQPLRALGAAGSAAASGAAVADWWRSVFNRVADEARDLAGGGKIYEAQPQPR